MPPTGVSDLQGTLLNSDVFSRNFQTFLKGPYQDIGTRNLGCEEDQNVVVAGDGGLQVPHAELDRTAEFAPKIKLPRSIKTEVDLTISRIQGRGCVRCVLAQIRAGVRSSSLLQLGVFIADCDS